MRRVAPRAHDACMTKTNAIRRPVVVAFALALAASGSVGAFVHTAADQAPAVQARKSGEGQKDFPKVAMRKAGEGQKDF